MSLSEVPRFLPMMRRPGPDSVLLKPCFLPFMLITRFACNSLSKILLWQTNLQETDAIVNKAEDLLSRIDTLEQCFNSCPSDREELNRRADVIRCVAISHVALGAEFLSSKFEDIEGRLRCFSRESGHQRLANSVQDLGKVSGLLGDLREIVFDYQVRS